MKHIKYLTLVLVLLTLTACNENEDLVVNDVTGIITNQSVEDIAEELEGVGYFRRLMLINNPHDPSFVGHNKAILMNVITGEGIIVYEFEQNEEVLNSWELGNGYYAAWGGEWIFHSYDNIEQNFRLVIFDESQNPPEILIYNEEELPQLSSSVLRLEYGELFV